MRLCRPGTRSVQSTVRRALQVVALYSILHSQCALGLRELKVTASPDSFRVSNKINVGNAHLFRSFVFFLLLISQPFITIFH